MKIEIEIRECTKELYMHQGGFSLSDNGKEVIMFAKTVPGGLPYIFIKDGKNKGKQFIIDAKEMQRVCALLIDIDITK